MWEKMRLSTDKVQIVVVWVFLMKVFVVVLLCPQFSADSHRYHTPTVITDISSHC